MCFGDVECLCCEGGNFHNTLCLSLAINLRRRKAVAKVCFVGSDAPWPECDRGGFISEDALGFSPPVLCRVCLMISLCRSYDSLKRFPLFPWVVFLNLNVFGQAQVA